MTARSRSHGKINSDSTCNFVEEFKVRRSMHTESALSKRVTLKCHLRRNGGMSSTSSSAPSPGVLLPSDKDSACELTYNQATKRRALLHRLIRHSYCNVYLSKMKLHRNDGGGFAETPQMGASVRANGDCGCTLICCRRLISGVHAKMPGGGGRFHPPRHRQSNPLKRIFLQDSSPESSDTTSDAATSATNTSESSGINPLSTNPFKKSPQDDNWGKEASYEHRPILAPPRLRAPEAASFSSSRSTVGSNVLRISTILRPSSGGMLGTSGGSLFNASSFPSSKSSSSSPNKPTFKLKPSMLSGFTTSSQSASSSGNTSGSASAIATSSTSLTPAKAPDSIEGNDLSTGKSPAANLFGGPTNEKEESLRASSGSQSEAKASPLRPQVTFASSEKEAAAGSLSEARPPSTSSEDLSTSSLPVVGVPASSPPSSSASNLARPAFVPLSTNEASPSEDSAKVNGLAANSTSPLSSRVSGGFIFGQNLQNRVSGIDEGEIGLFGTVGATANGEMIGVATENLFAEAATGLTPLGPPSSEEGGAWGGKTLVESSRELSEKEASQKRKYEEVEIITGEESESNVLQMMCKLYWFSMGSWQEKGRGHLRLNDRKINGEIHSRLVIRTQGTYTVMLNAKIWADMSIEKTNDKSVRFTASDADGQPKIFLVMGTTKDIDLLYTSLEYRVAESKLQKPPSPSDSIEQESKKLKKGVDPPLST